MTSVVASLESQLMVWIALSLLWSLTVLAGSSGRGRGEEALQHDMEALQGHRFGIGMPTETCDPTPVARVNDEEPCRVHSRIRSASIGVAKAHEHARYRSTPTAARDHDGSADD